MTLKRGRSGVNGLGQVSERSNRARRFARRMCFAIRSPKRSRPRRTEMAIDEPAPPLNRWLPYLPQMFRTRLSATAV